MNYLQEYEGELHFAADCWTSPNHRPFLALTVHYERDSEAVTWLLDIIEVNKHHTGLELARAFISILENYGIVAKVSLQQAD